MRWIVIGFIAYWFLSMAYALIRSLWMHDGAACIAAALLLAWGGFALYWSL